MIIFVKKLKSKEGINSFDLEKIKKDIPAGYKAVGMEPMVTLTANHAVVAYKCEKVEKASPKPDTKPAKTEVKAKPKNKKAIAKA